MREDDDNYRDEEKEKVGVAFFFAYGEIRTIFLSAVISPAASATTDATSARSTGL